VLARKRQDQQRTWLWSMIEDGLRAQFLARDDVKRRLPEMEQAVADGRLTPTEAARRLLDTKTRPGSRPIRRA
jgi:LAO/AO transport system kinase